MWINFKNLNGGDVEDVIPGEEVRKSCGMLVEPRSIYMRETKYGKTSGIIIVVDSKTMPPKLHFLDKDKAEALYSKLMHIIINQIPFSEIDALAEGAI